MRSEPDEDGWISITSEPVEEKDLNTLVAAAMEKPAAGEQAAATAPAEEPEVVETFQYQYPSLSLIHIWFRPETANIPVLIGTVYSEFYGFFDGLKGVGPEEAVGLSAAETLREQFRTCLLYTSRCV